MSMSKITEKVDVIAEFKADGQIIPMRFRLMTEDGEYEQFTIKAVKQIEKKGTYTTEDGVYVCEGVSVSMQGNHPQHRKARQIIFP